MKKARRVVQFALLALVLGAPGDAVLKMVVVQEDQALAIRRLGELPQLLEIERVELRQVELAQAVPGRALPAARPRLGEERRGHMAVGTPTRIMLVASPIMPKSVGVIPRRISRLEESTK